MSIDAAGIETADRVRAQLALRGWAWIRRSISEREFEEIARDLGDVGARTDIVVDPALDAEQGHGRTIDPERPSVYQEAELDFHTDRPTVDVIGWYCVMPDGEAGANLLIDTSSMTEQFTDAELDALSEVRVRYSLPDAVGPEIMADAPLITREGTGVKVFFVPWQVTPPTDERRARALDGFVRYLADEVDRACLRIRLDAGQCLFIDNHRLLHGRGPLAAGSRRHLVRLYIRNR